MQSTAAEQPQVLDLSGFSDAALRGLATEAVAALAARDGGDGALLDVATDALARLRRTAVAGEDDRDLLDEAALGESLRRVQALVGAAQAEKLRRLHALSQRGAFRVDAERSAADWVVAQLGETARSAHAQVRTAAALDRLPSTADGLACGQLTISHADAAARGLATLDRETQVRQDECGDDIDAYLAVQADADAVVADYDAMVATIAPKVGPTGLSQQIAAWTIRTQPDAAAAQDRRAAARRGFVESGDKDSDGLWKATIRYNDADRAHINAALRPLSRKRSADDDRPLATRMLDALIDTCRRTTGRDDMPTRGGQRARIILLGTDAGLAGDDGADPVWVDGVGPVTSDTAKLLACDADTLRAMLNTATGEWNIGRANGDPTPTQRALVIARDVVCVGCGADASQCQLHHIIWRRKGGKTLITNLVLVCWSCHIGIHHLGWQVVNDAGTYRIRKVATPR
jgi:hypothetical protein